MEENKNLNLEDAFGELLGGGMEQQQIDGDAQLLEVASKHTLQLNLRQIKVLLHLEMCKELYLTDEKEIAYLDRFVKNYIQYTSHNSSQSFIDRVLEHISLRRFINENSLKVNVDKNT